MRHQRFALVRFALSTTSMLIGMSAWAQAGDDQHLAEQLANPIADLMSVPFQLNWDHDIGPARDGRRLHLNFQPVIPFKLNPAWNIVSRTIVPIVDQDIPGLGDGSQGGIGDITQSLFLAPTKTRTAGLHWGVGPVILIPSHTDFISSKKWGLGPTAVVLKQAHGWTYGALANHIWSVGGNGPQNLSKTFVQPFLSYATKTAWTFTVNTESTYDWKDSRWTVPLNASVAKLIRIGNLPVNFALGARYYAESPDSGPHGWGARVIITLLFPVK
jgi:hypothetical protein